MAPALGEVVASARVTAPPGSARSPSPGTAQIIDEVRLSAAIELALLDIFDAEVAVAAKPGERHKRALTLARSPLRIGVAAVGVNRGGKTRASDRCRGEWIESW